MSAPYIKVAIFEDNKDLREGIRHVLNATSGSALCKFSCVVITFAKGISNMLPYKARKIADEAKSKGLQKKIPNI